MPLYRKLPNGVMAPTSWQIERALSMETPEQRSLEWFELRKNKITGSIVDAVLGSNPYQRAEDVLLTKAGRPDMFSGNEATAHGTLYEPVAVAAYCAKFNRHVEHCGLIPHDSHPLMAHSPDGLSFDLNGVDEPVLLEVKCPLRRKIAADGAIPGYYMGQVQMGMSLFGVKKAHFCQYKPPTASEPEVLTVSEVLAEPGWLSRAGPVVEAFWAQVMHWRDAGWQNHPAALLQKAQDEAKADPSKCLIPDF